MELLEDEAPLTVANFINYIEDDDFDNTFFHRSVPDFIIQGGGFYFSPTIGEAVPKDPPVINEFNVSNTRGTVAMAKLSGDPNSATSEWFINLADNGGSSAFLDTQNAGFTVFARVVGDGMDVVDAIASLERVDLSATLGTAFSTVPVVSNPGSGIAAENLVQVFDIYLTDVVDIPAPPDNPDPPADPGSGGTDTDGIETLTEFSDGQFILPVRVGNRMLQVYMLLEATAPSYVFRVNLINIIELADVGQEAASYNHSDGILHIPSIRAGSKVFTDVEFILTNSEILEFTLQSFNQL